MPKYKFVILLFFFTITIKVCCSQTASKADKLYEKGIALYSEGKYGSAVENFQKALEKGYENTALLNFSLGNAYQFWGKYKNAITHYQLAVNLKYSDIAEIYYQLSTSFFQLQDYPASIDYCKRIFELSPKTQDSRVYWRLNLIYSIQGKPEKAQAIIKQGATAGIQEFQIYCDKRQINWKE